MSDIKISDSSFDLLDYSAFGYFFLFAIIVEILVSLPGLNVDSDLVSSTDYSWINWYFEINHLSNAQTLGQILYTDYFVFFLSAGFILFIALIGSLTLTVTLNKSYKLH
jgi:NADH-quinone oxidoreductase subunit J